MKAKFLVRIVLTFLFVSLSASQSLWAGKPRHLHTEPGDYLSDLSGAAVKFKHIQSGDTVYSLLQSVGFSTEEVNQVLADDVLPKPFVLVPGDRYRLAQRAKKFIELKFYDQKEDVSYVFWKKNGEIGAQAEEEAFTIKVRSAKGEVNGALVTSIRNKVDDKWIVFRFMDAYALDFDLPRVLERGAHFAITYEMKYDGHHFIKYGEVVRTELEVGGKIHTRHFVSYSNGGSFIDSTEPHEDRPFYSPVNYIRVSSHYEPRRFHPVRKRWLAHQGVDFELPEGEDVFTVAPGRVLRKGRNRGAGNYVVIRHANGMESYYNHLASINSTIRPGVHVVHGQKIGTIGCTGWCTKAHLHFAVKKRGQFINPIAFLRSYPYRKKALVERRIASLK